MTLHGTAVSVAGNALIIVGPSGSGKSSLALQMLAFGAELIADDRVILSQNDGQLFASCPDQISGLIEARYVGVLNATAAAPAPVALAVDLGQVEQDRVPEHRTVTWLNHNIPLLWGIKKPHFAASLIQMLKAGRSNT